MSAFTIFPPILPCMKRFDLMIIIRPLVPLKEAVKGKLHKSRDLVVLASTLRCVPHLLRWWGSFNWSIATYIWFSTFRQTCSPLKQDTNCHRTTNNIQSTPSNQTWEKRVLRGVAWWNQRWFIRLFLSTFEVLSTVWANTKRTARNESRGVQIERTKDKKKIDRRIKQVGA